jgi:hypothetical protein
MLRFFVFPELVANGGIIAKQLALHWQSILPCMLHCTATRVRGGRRE